MYKYENKNKSIIFSLTIKVLMKIPLNKFGEEN
jgi:hypothetical protein